MISLWISLFLDNIDFISSNCYYVYLLILIIVTITEIIII